LFNDIDCIEKTTDKSMTTFLLSYFGLKTPLTWVPEKKRIAKEILQKQSKKKLISILKPLFGSQGKRIKILKNNKLNESLDNVYYLQNFENNKSRTSEKNWEDYRILVCHQKVIASIKRTNKKELTNISQGARPIKINPNKEMVKIAIKASTIEKDDYSGD
jgi:glutathione synthase/RimK-type ligase-like ATP-grasp enzyme